MITLARALPLLAVGTVLLAGCGGGDSGSSGGDTTSLSREESGLAPTKSDGAVHISMGNYKYKPSMVTVKPGQKVVWDNPESITHNVKSIRGASFESDTLKKGDSFSFTPKKSGLVDYECTLHPGMLATIVVQ